MEAPVNYRDKWILLAGIISITFFEYYLTYDVFHWGWMMVYELISDALKILIIWLIIRKTIIYLDHVFPWANGFVKRLGIQLLATNAIGVSLLTILVHLEYYFIRPYENQHFFSFDIVIAVIFIIQVNIIYIGLYYYHLFIVKKELVPGTEKEDKDHFFVKLGNKNIKIDFKEIIACFAEAKETFVMTDEGKTYITNYSLDKLEDILPSHFFRANRKYIISSKVILEVRPDVNGKLRLRLKRDFRIPEEIIISRIKAPSFRKWLELKKETIHPSF